MQKTLIIGRTYAVTTTSSCDVTDANGTLITTVYAGQQAVFVAPTTTVTFSDDAASVVAVFKLALAKTMPFEQLGGGVSNLPSTFIAAKYLESNGSASMKTDVIPTAITGAWGDIIDSSRWCESYSAADNRFCAPSGSVGNYAGYFYFSGLWKSLLSINGEYISSINWKNSRKVTVKNKSNGTYKESTLPSPSQTATAPLVLFYYPASIRSAKISEAEEIIRDFLPAIDPAGVPCMFDTITQQSYYTTSASGYYIVGLTVEQARKLSKLPTGGGTLTISLPAAIVDGDSVTDVALQTALRTAAAKGWTITIQTYTEQQ